MVIRSCIIVSAVLSLFSPVFGETTQTPNPAPYALSVSFDIPNSKIMGRARIPVVAGQKITFVTDTLSVSRVHLSGKHVERELKNGTLTAIPPETGILEITFEGVFRPGGAEGNMNFGVTSSTIDSRGISLTGIWYPQPASLSVYTLTATLPRGYNAVSEAEKITKTEKGAESEFLFEFAHPVDGINLIATDRYEVVTDRYRDIELTAYFFPEDKRLAEEYIGYTKKYLALYEKLLAPYPYRRFSIVENFLPTGYSMATYTVLGQEVVRLPFIVETSLGHEILHQWFGNLVYIDFSSGNWAEGLTTYLADHLYEEQKGKGWEYRKQILIDYASTVHEENEFALRDFRGRFDFASRAIGYGKAAMVFHMLKNMLGEDNFSQMLKQIIQEKSFQRASWDDFKRASEKIARKDLSWFFKQWVDEKGLPSLRLENAELLQNGDAYEVRFAVVQAPKPYRLSLPVTDTYLQGGSKTHLFDIEKEKESYAGLLDQMPGKVTLDENYDVARRLDPREFPPVIARLLGDEKPLLALPVNMRDVYASVIETFRKRGAVEREPGEIKQADVKSTSLIILGNDNPLIEKLFGSISLPQTGFSVVMKKNPWNPEKVVALFSARSRDEVEAAFQKIFHYGKYSVLSFDKGRNISKKILDSDRGIVQALREETIAIDLSTRRTLTDVIRGAVGKKIVYVGEFHDRVSNHNVQFQVVQGLYRKNNRIAVGMEMFQRPFQTALDDYITGSIDERAFLMRSEYFKRWGFDYNLYKPILDFCREKKIPVVALNIRRETIEKVAQKGIDELSAEEKKEVPAQMDFSDAEYQERVKEVYNKHKGTAVVFDNFYQAQIVWDEIMAQSIDEYLKKDPDAQMVVIAGGGHLAHGSGIPKRTFRRNGYEYTIILNDEDAEQGIADFIVLSEPLNSVTAPKLNAMFREEGGRLAIAALSEESILKKAGIVVGDVLISLDNTSIKEIDDVKLVLFFKKKGDVLNVNVLRKRFLLGDKEMAFAVKIEK